MSSLGRHGWLCVVPYLSKSLPLCCSLTLYSYYPSFLQNHIPHFHSRVPPPPLSSFPPFCAFPPPYSTLLIFKSHMLPARLAQLHPANEGLFIGLRLSAAKQGLARAEAGASLAAPHPPLLHRPLHMPVLVWPCRPEADYLSLLSLIADSSWKEPERERDIVERGEGTVLACWAVTWQAWTQRFVFLLSNPGSVLVGFIKMDVVFIKCWWEVMVFWTVPRMSNRVYKMQMMRKESWWSINLTTVHVNSLNVW